MSVYHQNTTEVATDWQDIETFHLADILTDTTPVTDDQILPSKPEDYLTHLV
jgi:hypothetical protein